MSSPLTIQQPMFSSPETPMASTFARTLRAFAERERVSLSIEPKQVTKLEIAKKPDIAKKNVPRPAGSPLTPGGPTAKEKAAQAPTQEPPIEVKAEKEAAPQPLLLRAWSWLQKNNKFSATKQLRVSETISLGDKRFVSLIHVDGQKFLIGGGASGVSLLTQLGAGQASADVLQAIAGASELSK
jgi:hypothetical protein